MYSKQNGGVCGWRGEKKKKERKKKSFMYIYEKVYR